MIQERTWEHAAGEEDGREGLFLLAVSCVTADWTYCKTSPSVLAEQTCWGFFSSSFYLSFRNICSCFLFGCHEYFSLHCAIIKTELMFVFISFPTYFSCSPVHMATPHSLWRPPLTFVLAAYQPSSPGCRYHFQSLRKSLCVTTYLHC